ncbi:beta-hydroxyacyl-(acyl-carrier-protein) dehydratase FabZ [Nitrosococcus halophilus Nc 4]|uniref:3-hydroxyacyl-[acyl-carrier-protein] dehydratase FabZ n=2 Tax=Nitrosococcus TaxID=1227 RepID=D5BVX1_NITHN|nr:MULTISPECIES: 3-hydroxyacyl-ACP dehydratase FabZ [Nitrosococcus]ADE15550.1 beta-hydroxyacyl-(acyl-carrier-protein) dehydratase FabZ [Nitrosococcus halophilus Nc 4]QBQ54726.1 3-hydroxyacyl-ACP dehydratase FabZ [Nitrosococcus wardiae]
MDTLDIHEILKHLPHRYPFLLIDRIIECTPGKSLVAIKNVSYNEPYFQGHFPEMPVMPGVLILESLAQATGILAFKTQATLPSQEAIYYFAGIDRARFKRPVEPGDQMRLEVELVRSLRRLWKFTGKVTVDGSLVASADVMCSYKEIHK